jgi:hypothetical protein
MFPQRPKPDQKVIKCPEYEEWKLVFSEGGYTPHHPG